MAYFALGCDVYHDSVRVAHDEDFYMLIVDLFCGLFCSYYRSCLLYSDIYERIVLRGHFVS